MSIAHFAIVGASIILLVLFCVALQGRPQRRSSAKNSDPAKIADGSVKQITPDGRAETPADHGSTSLEQQLRETLRRVQAGETLAALSHEAHDNARVQVANDSARAAVAVQS